MLRLGVGGQARRRRFRLSRKIGDEGDLHVSLCS
jgi:hypothetical protein